MTVAPSVMPLIRTAAYTLFAAQIWLICVRIPFVTLVPGERTNLFAGLLFALCLGGVAAWKLATTDERKVSRDVFISLALAGLCMASGLLSENNPSETYRAAVLILSILGGYWTARLGFTRQLAPRLLMRLFLPALGGLLAVSFYGFAVTGEAHHYTGLNPHAQADVLILLGFVPLLMAANRDRRTRTTGVVLCLLIVAALALNDALSPLFILPFTILTAFYKGRKRIKFLITATALLLCAAGYFFALAHLGQPDLMRYESTYYRAENYTFSAHIVSKHPVFGIGLRAPRDADLATYETWFPGVDKRLFKRTADRVVTSENIFMTLAVGCGIPFTLLYSAALFGLLGRFCSAYRRSRGMRRATAQAFLIPILCCLIHSLLYDSFLQPEVAFLFHFLLGMTPVILTINTDGNDSRTENRIDNQ